MTQEGDREEFLAAARQHAELVGVELPIGTVLLFTSDDRLEGGKLAKEMRRVAAPLGRALSTLGLEPGEAVVVDVGADAGVLTLAALVKFRVAHVVACEPRDEVATVLQATLELNGRSDAASVVGSTVPAVDHPLLEGDRPLIIRIARDPGLERVLDESAGRALVARAVGVLLEQPVAPLAERVMEAGLTRFADLRKAAGADPQALDQLPAKLSQLLLLP